jgi:nitrilase
MTKVAVVQAATVLFDTPATIEKLARLAAEAAAQGAKLAVFPEAFVGGYPKGMDFDARVGSRTQAGREWFGRYHDNAINVPSDECAFIGEIAARHGMQLVVGVIERDGGTLYCSVLFFAADGTLSAKHRKVMPTAMERLIWGQGDGSTLPVLHTDIGKVGAAICWENYMPLLRTSLFGQGIEIYCAPTVDDRELWAVSMRHIAAEGRCFVLSAVQYATCADAPAECPIENVDRNVLIRGGSVICGPMGNVLAGPVYDQEAILTADIDLREITLGKYDLDVVGHYARPDIFSLHVDMSAKRPVSYD